MLKRFIRQDPIRPLAVFGIALPLAIIIVGNGLRRILGDQDAIEWMTIIAGFWFIAGTLATGLALIRAALRRRD